jgi:MFS family permease
VDQTAFPSPAQRRLLTYRFERGRAISAGILESAGTTFLLLIAVRWFAAGSLAKGLVASGGAIGLLVSPWVVSWTSRRGIPPSLAASRMAAFGAGVFLVTAAIPALPLFVFASLFGMAASSAATPLLTQIYQENYPEHERGRLFSRTVMIRIAAAALFGEIAGRLLSIHIEWFRGLLILFALAFAFASFCLRRCPSFPLAASEGTHPFHALRYAREDKLFRRTLICWMLMGSANLMMLPLRIEFLANPQYATTSPVLSPSSVAFYTAVLPNLARLVMSPVWGALFDRMNFFLLRVVLNLGFAIGILSFFTSASLAGLIFAAIVLGISTAGGDVAWSLWVTKFAPPERVADYMSVHTCFTGLRGVFAPLLAFWAISKIPGPSGFAYLGWFNAGLIVFATLLLLPEIPLGKFGRKSSALVEEISE